MITWGEFVNLVEEKIAGVGEFFSSHSPDDLGEDQKLTLSEPPMVPQEIPAVQQYDSAPKKLENFALTRLPVDQVYSSAEKIYPNKDGLMADIYGVPVKNPDGTYTDYEGHTIMSSDVDGSPILPRDVPQYYEWYKRNDFANETGGNIFSSNVRAEYLIAPNSAVLNDLPDLTNQEIKNNITLEYVDDFEMWVKAKHGVPLEEEYERMNAWNRVNTQKVYDFIGDTVKDMKSRSVSQEKETREVLAKSILNFQRVSPKDPLYESKLQEVMNTLNGVQDSIDPGGMKFVGGLNRVIKASKAGNIIEKVEIVDRRGSPLGEIDGIDLKNSLFIEDKSAKGLDIINPRTGMPQQTPEQWADKQIFSKTETRINQLENNAVATRATKDGSLEIPFLSDIKNIRKFQFKIDADTPQLRQAVNDSIEQLRTKYPDYTFEVKFGGGN